MYLVSDLMTRELITLKASDDLSLADTILSLARVRHLPVVDERQHLIGLVTHRDLLRAFAERGRSTAKITPAREVMTVGVHTVKPETPLRRALKTMIRNKHGCLPVVDNEGVLVGLVTEFDLVKFAAHFMRDLDEVEKVALDSRREMADASQER